MSYICLAWISSYMKPGTLHGAFFGVCCFSSAVGGQCRDSDQCSGKKKVELHLEESRAVIYGCSKEWMC